MCTGFSKKLVGRPRNEDKVFVRVVTIKYLLKQAVVFSSFKTRKSSKRISNLYVIGQKIFHYRMPEMLWSKKSCSEDTWI